MAEGIDWNKILEGRYPSYKVEVLAFLDSLDISSSNEISAENVYEAIKDDPNVLDNLKLIYKEALYGTNKKAKARISNRMANFKRGLR